MPRHRRQSRRKQRAQAARQISAQAFQRPSSGRASVAIARNSTAPQRPSHPHPHPHSNTNTNNQPTPQRHTPTAPNSSRARNASQQPGISEERLHYNHRSRLKELLLNGRTALEAARLIFNIARDMQKDSELAMDWEPSSTTYFVRQAAAAAAAAASPRIGNGGLPSKAANDQAE